MRRLVGSLIVMLAAVACGAPETPQAAASAAPTPQAESPGALPAPPATASRAGSAASAPGSASAYANAAISAAAWIRSTAITSATGTAWPADPHDEASVVTNLYTGTPGVVLFFLELAAHTGDDSYLDDARAGADFLLARLAAPATDPTMQSAGLHTGLASVGFVLNETYVATGDDRFREGALRAVELIHGQARAAGVGVDWEDSTDIISGGAGTGLFLLYAAREMDHPASLDLAVRAGRHLLEVAEQHPTGLGWRINPEYPRLMPNFSHGTAGVAYFLAVLHEATGNQAFLDAAEAGANRLLSLADTEGDVCLVFHHTDGGEQLQYLSWCHGPAGTARTFYKLWQITADPAWMEWTERSANGVYQSGIPDTLTEGFWNNVGQCCGSAGVAEFALAMNEVGLGTAVRGPDRIAAAGGTSSTDAAQRHLEFAHRTADDLLSRASAAGVGMMLLHLDAAIRGAPSPRIVFPDSPY